MTVIVVKDDVAFLLGELTRIREHKKQLLKQEEVLMQKLYNVVGEHDEMVSEDGQILGTWKYSSDSDYFDHKRFQAEEPILFNEYLATRPGSRRLVIK